MRSQIKKAVIPAAGLGTRFYPITKCIPKEMLPIKNKPIIHYVIDEAIQSGITDIAIITRKGKTVIEDYIDEMNFEANFYYLRQKYPMGLGHAVLTAEGFIGEEDFAVLLGDDLLDNNRDLQNMMKLNHCIAVESVVDPSKYGVVSIKDNKIIDIIEKPKKNAPSNYGVVGRYILPYKIFKYIKKQKTDENDEIQLTYAIRDMIREGYSFSPYYLTGKRYDCGTPDSYKGCFLDYF